MNGKERDTLKAIQSQFGKNSVDFFNNLNQITTIISSGCLKLDRILGINGIPKSRIIEIYGNESSGKTTVAITIAANWQKNGMKVAYIDAEKSLSGKYIQSLGINVNELILAQPTSGEQAFSIIEALLKTEMIDLIIVDSVAALMPQTELNATIDEQNIGLHARLMSRGLRRIQSIMNNQSAAVIFINQLREKVGTNFGNFETTTGGRALKFYSSMRIEIKRTEILKNAKESYGVRSRVTINKNKLAIPFKSTYINILFNSGVDKINDEIDLALEFGIITQNGSWYNYQNAQLCQGRERLGKIWKEENENIKAIQNEIKIRLENEVNAQSNFELKQKIKERS